MWDGRSDPRWDPTQANMIKYHARGEEESTMCLKGIWPHKMQRS
ncbi:hypothetical protein OOU_Y34scaffold00253g4 [Pyricularia oryzae Y34]|uniref:Uncharacterized protein n=3 Tax=Pyricularia oryzae TaxID=318829 RepID=A0A4P7NI15_PYROR|nr:hypothetical protein OOU_Y34scaffold00253g4 [Pyricularia oryzae Y34]QBZ61556.1 hypothetical protein PoMZ_08507 [Pyricularia oryzae]